MAAKRGKITAATDELDSLFEGIGDNKTGASSTSTKKTAGKSGVKAPTKGKTAAAAEKDILAELENELGEQISRPHTPRTTVTKGSPVPGTSGATLPRRSFESSKAISARTSTDERTPAVAPTIGEVAEPTPALATVAAPAVSAGGWWGGILSAATSTASAAMKQAEAAVKEIQQNEEAKKWADQVRGNYTTLRGFVGEELRHRALPTFTDILHTLAPPIASHERLLIHITHDMVGYPSLDPLVHEMFSRVMAQVEGGDLLVVQRGQEAQPGHDSGNYGRDSAGWRDGPWWRALDQPRDLGMITGLHEGTKLCRASAEAYANEYYAAHYGMSENDGRGSSKRGLEVARQRAFEPVSEDNPVRRSDLFLAVQAISISGASNGDVDDDEDDEDEDEDEDDDEGTSGEEDDMVSFAVHIVDPVHKIVYHTVSQAIPAKWVRWLDARPTQASGSTLTPAMSGSEADSDDSSNEESEDDDDDDDNEEKTQKQKQPQQSRAPKKSQEDSLPDDIRAIVDSGGVDPREWVAEWVEEALSLAVGIVAQRYVAHRMGVGAGSIGRGKRPVGELLADGAGEAARAGIL
ncbi:hypothetical protein SEPCBS57363_002191 [Sporothrix epigloea]|uniref:Maintenance of telomere capping protein 1 n=1 Tax=Sporothrix epigloea TaxID=1892477 RepID=A0ABP0DG39_9PEZI